MLNVTGRYRQYSISSSPQQTQEVEIVADTTPMGAGSKYLLSLQLHDPVTFRAPLGVFVLQQTDLPKIFLATGTGIAPLKSMVLDLAARDFKEDYHLLWGIRTHSDAYFKNDFEQLDTLHPSFHYHMCFSQEDPRDTTELKGHVQDGLKTLFPNINFVRNYEFYICGRSQTVDGIKESLLNDFQIPASRTFHEKFT